MTGCGSSASSKPPENAASSAHRDDAPQVTAEELSAPENALKIAPLRLMKDGALGLELDAEGYVSVPERGVLGRLGYDGKFADKHGATIVELTSEGALLLANGSYLPVTIDPDGTVHLLKEARVVRLADDGSLEGANPAGPTVRVEGVTAPTRRTAMFLLVLASYPIPSHH